MKLQLVINQKNQIDFCNKFISQKQMNNQTRKSHERSSEFFASKNFKSFNQDLSMHELSPNFQQLSLKCCGYGYFPNYKQKMIVNFMSYLTEAINVCTEITTIKIILNGFDVSDKTIKKLCNEFRPLIDRKRLKTIWLHTTNLRNCSQEDIKDLFDLIDKCGLDINCEQISIQMADWEFSKGYPSYFSLVNIFQTFFDNIMTALYFRKFRLQISSWYMKEKEAYTFLKDTLKNQVLKTSFMSSKGDENQGNANRTSAASRLQQEDRQKLQQALEFFLQHMDEKYLKPTYPHKKTSDKYNQEQKKNHDQMLTKMIQCEEIVSKKLVKYPNEFTMQLRVDEFHKNMTVFLGGLLYKLPNIQEYHIDMRNWNGMFNMSGLKKQLDTRVNSKQQFSLIRRSLGLASKAIGKALQGEQVGLKTIYTM